MTLTTKFKTKVTISHLKAKLFNQIGFLDLKIHNLPKYPTPYALEIGEVEIKANFLNYFKNITKIDIIHISNISLYVNYHSGKANWEEILKKLNQSESPIKDKTLLPSYSTIHKLIIENISVYVENESGQSRIHKVDKLVLQDVKTLNGEITRRVSEAILSQFFFNFKNIVEVPLEMPENLLTNPIEGAVEDIESLIKIF
jgi:hypothetical protein